MEKKKNVTVAAEKLTAVGGINKYRKEIMGLAALSIFIFHRWSGIAEAFLPNHPSVIGISRFIRTHGFAGVDVFLLLSGIGLVWAAEKSSVGSFYLRRIKRVYVPYFICMTALSVFTGQTFLRWLQLVSGYTFFFKGIYIVPWFVPAVLFLYLLFPLYNFILKKLRFTVLVTVCVLGLWYAGSRFLPINYFYYGFYNRIPVFLIGVMLGRLEKEGKFPKSKFLYLAGPVLIALGVVTANLVEEKGVALLVPAPNCFIPTLCLGCGTALTVAFILDFLHRFKIAGKIADIISVPFSSLGKISLEFYLAQTFTIAGVIASECGIVSVSASSALRGDILVLIVTLGIAVVLNMSSGLVLKLIPDGRKKR